MTPRRSVRRVAGSTADARLRREEGHLLLERAGLGDATNSRSGKVDVAIAALAGIAYADAICLAALGERSAGSDHSDAVVLLREVVPRAAAHLQVLVSVETAAQYGVDALSQEVVKRALRAADLLAERADRF